MSYEDQQDGNRRSNPPLEEISDSDPYSAAFAFRPAGQHQHRHHHSEQQQQQQQQHRYHSRNTRKALPQSFFSPSSTEDNNNNNNNSNNNNNNNNNNNTVVEATKSTPSPTLRSRHNSSAEGQINHSNSPASPQPSPSSLYKQNPFLLFKTPTPHASPPTLRAEDSQIASSVASPASEFTADNEPHIQSSPRLPPLFPRSESSSTIASPPLSPALSSENPLLNTGGVRRRPQLKLQLPTQSHPRSGPSPKGRSPTPTSSPPAPIFMPSESNLKSPAEPSPHYSKFNIRLTAEDAKALRSLHKIASPSSPSSLSTPSSPSSPFSPFSPFSPLSPSSPSEEVTTPVSPLEGEVIGEPSLEGSWRRRGSSVFATLPQELTDTPDRPKRPAEPGMVFPENGGSFRRKIAGGGGLWDPSVAQQGLQEMDVELPPTQQNSIISFLRQALFLLAQMHFLSLYRYLGLYTPFVIKLDMMLSIDSQFYLTMNLNDRMALGVGYGLHNACIGFFAIALMTRVVGYDQVKFLFPFNFLLGSMIASFVFVRYYETSAYVTLRQFYPIIVYVLIGVQIIGTAALYGFRANKLKAITSFIAGLTVALLAFVGILDYFGVPLYIDCTPIEKSLFRIGVVPCLFIVKVVLVRLLCRITERSGIYMRTDAGTFVFLVALIPVFVRAFYGRIFFLNVPSLGNLAWNAVIVEFLDLVVKLVHWNRRYIFRFFTSVEKYKVLTPLLAQPSGDPLYASCLCFEKCIGISFATLLRIFYEMKWSSNPQYAFTIYSFFILYTVQSLSHCVSMKLEIMHNIPIFQTMKSYPLKTVYFPLGVTTFIMCSICGWRGAFILHGLNLV